MKKYLFFMLAVMSVSIINAQFSDNFESYAAGDMINASSSDWTTWSGAAAEDAPISTDYASSGMNSLKLEALAAGGGPTDIVLPFGQKYTEGTFNLEMKMYLVSNKDAYFNFQGETNPGDQWVLSAYFEPSGAYRIDNANNLAQAQGTLTQDAWHTLRFEVDLTNNKWDFYLDGALEASFGNNVNTLASLNLFPTTNSLYYVDDVSFDYIVPSVFINDIGVYNANLDIPVVLAGSTSMLSCEVKNNGTSALTSFDASFQSGTSTGSESITGINVAPGETHTFDFLSPMTLSNDMVNITVSNASTGDVNPTNDSRSFVYATVTPAEGKIVVVEENTGTWCGWCPRGEVALKGASAAYPDDLVTIAVHNGDPMVVVPYDSVLTGMPGFSGFPNMFTDRARQDDPGAIYNTFAERVVLPPVATLFHYATLDTPTSTLEITIDAHIQEALTGDYRLAVVITEDEVTGTSSGYNQTNYYAGGGEGEMGGYENLPGSVPAADMVYDHVAREILGTPVGEMGSLPSSMLAGSEHSYSFSTVLDSMYDLEHIHIISMLINNGTDVVENAQKFTLAETIENSDTTSEEVAIFQLEKDETLALNAFPNPATDRLNVNLELDKKENIIMSVISADGKVIASRDYGIMNTGEYYFPIDVSNYASGVYLIKVQTATSFLTKTVIVE